MSDIPKHLEDELIKLCAEFCFLYHIPINELQRFVGELLLLVGKVNEVKFNHSHD